ncbi:papilin [Culex quinquefasciatus]|uniref:Papilin n=1 Tax=Culex quinquefasciatus TaxID=7176 RepID=B0W469_CULQU|nr:papilin [Culex quinquefasciatus]|eukprot:XP_001843503.1 papilin [Culex quinquefasciatus]
MHLGWPWMFYVRHKRQYGSNLYLPESYIIPGDGTGGGGGGGGGGGEDDDQWGPWSAPSECSRTCGGGVAHQTRECYNLGLAKLLQFTFRAARDEFYRRYLSSRNLSLSHLGFSVNKRIYLNENLTELARSIKGSALKMKKDGKLHSVFTKDGFVQVKDRAEDEARPVHSVEQLANKPFP